MKSSVPHGRWAILSLALAVLPLMTATAQKPPPKGTPQFAPDRVLVAFKQTVKQEARLAAVAKVGLQVDTRLKSDHLTRLIISPQKLASGLDVKKAIAALKADPAVRVAEPDWIVHSTSVPNDPYFRWQWALRNDRQFGGKLDADIDIPKAWDVTRGSPSMKVAVIDTGVDYTHDDLAANILRDSIGNPVGYDFHNRDGDPMDDNGHGTHVSGIIGAVGNNRIGISGVCQTVKIIPIKFLDSDGYGYISDAILSADLARLLGARIMNNSWTGGGFSALLLEAIQRAKAVGILYVAAAGNDYFSNNDVTPIYPASLNQYADNVVAVAASDVSDNIAWFSNYGPNSVDIAAPGEYILSTVPGNSFDLYDGTSMAAPHVSGAAALVLSKYPTMKYWQVKTRLTGNADRPSGIAGKVRSGRLNAAGALVVDTIAPSAPKLFGASLRGLTALRLQWTAGGDDNAVGRAAEYQLRFSTSPITATSFDNAELVDGVPAPAASGSLQGVTKTGLSPNTTYYFALRSIDNGGNGSPIVYATASTRAEEKLLEDGAEGTPHFTGWPTESAPHSGTKCYSDSPDGDYASDVDLSLTSEPITLPASGEPFVSFWAAYALEEGYDYVYVGVSTDDGATYTTLDTFTGEDDIWNQHVYSLKPYAGQTIRVRFRIITDPIINEDGFYVDDIVIGNEASTTLLEDSVYVWGDLLFDFSPPWDVTDYTFHSPYWSYTDSYDWLYENNADTSLVQATSVYVPENVLPTLSFWIHYDLEESYDFLYVEVSTDDGTSWNRVGWLTGWHGGFEQIEIPLTEFVGQNIKVRFHLVTDSSVRKDGVYIDDIKIAGEKLAPYSLTKVSVDVKTAPAGSTVPFKAKLKRADNNAPIAGQRIDFYSNPTNTFLGFGITDSTGTATIMVTAPPVGVKKVINAEFAGDTSYAPSTGAGSITGQ